MGDGQRKNRLRGCTQVGRDLQTRTPEEELGLHLGSVSWTVRLKTVSRCEGKTILLEGGRGVCSQGPGCRAERDGVQFLYSQWKRVVVAVERVTSHLRRWAGCAFGQAWHGTHGKAWLCMGKLTPGAPSTRPRRQGRWRQTGPARWQRTREAHPASGGTRSRGPPWIPA